MEFGRPLCRIRASPAYCGIEFEALNIADGPMHHIEQFEGIFQTYSLQSL